MLYIIVIIILVAIVCIYLLFTNKHRMKGGMNELTHGTDRDAMPYISKVMPVSMLQSRHLASGLYGEIIYVNKIMYDPTFQIGMRKDYHHSVPPNPNSIVRENVVLKYTIDDDTQFLVEGATLNNERIKFKCAPESVIGAFLSHIPQLNIIHIYGVWFLPNVLEIEPSMKTIYKPDGSSFEIGEESSVSVLLEDYYPEDSFYYLNNSELVEWCLKYPDAFNTLAVLILFEFWKCIVHGVMPSDVRHANIVISFDHATRIPSIYLLDVGRYNKMYLEEDSSFANGILPFGGDAETLTNDNLLKAHVIPPKTGLSMEMLMSLLGLSVGNGHFTNNIFNTLKYGCLNSVCSWDIVADRLIPLCIEYYNDPRNTLSIKELKHVFIISANSKINFAEYEDGYQHIPDLDKYEKTLRKPHDPRPVDLGDIEWAYGSRRILDETIRTEDGTTIPSGSEIIIHASSYKGNLYKSILYNNVRYDVRYSKIPVGNLIPNRRPMEIREIPSPPYNGTNQLVRYIFEWQEMINDEKTKNMRRAAEDERNRLRREREELERKYMLHTQAETSRASFGDTKHTQAQPEMSRSSLRDIKHARTQAETSSPFFEDIKHTQAETSRPSFEDTKYTQAQGVIPDDMQGEMPRSSFGNIEHTQAEMSSPSFGNTKYIQTQGVISDDMQGETVIPLEDNIVENQSAESFDSFDSFNSQMI